MQLTQNILLVFDKGYELVKSEIIELQYTWRDSIKNIDILNKSSYIYQKATF